MKFMGIELVVNYYHTIFLTQINILMIEKFMKNVKWSCCYLDIVKLEGNCVVT